MNKHIICKSLIAIAFLTVVSCKKSYRCECSTYTQGKYVKTTSNTYKERKRSEATTACVAKSSAIGDDEVKCIIVD